MIGKETIESEIGSWSWVQKSQPAVTIRNHYQCGYGMIRKWEREPSPWEQLFVRDVPGSAHTSSPLGLDPRISLSCWCKRKMEKVFAVCLQYIQLKCVLLSKLLLTYLPNFSNWVFTPFYPFSPALPQFTSEAQRSCVISASPSHLRSHPSMLWIKKTMESCCEPFKRRCEWERMENAALIPPPHPCNTGKHHTGDISAHGKHCCEGLHTAQTKSTHSSSNLEPLGSTALHSEPKQPMILNKPVIEKSTFVPFSKTVSSKEI